MRAQECVPPAQLLQLSAWACIQLEESVHTYTALPISLCIVCGVIAVGVSEVGRRYVM